MPRKVPAVGPCPARLMLVGEAPGADEELQGEPFVGAAGRELNSWLRAGGIRRADAFVTNVCKYRPPGNKIDEWLRPAKKRGRPEGWGERDGMWYAPEIAEGLDELAAEIADVKPRCIVALGNTPLWALLGETGIVEWRGSQLVHEPSGAALIPMLHPAAVLRQYSWHELCIHDVKQRVTPSIDGPLSPPPLHKTVNPSSIETALSWMGGIAEGQWVAVDLETAGGAILCFGFASSPTDALVFDLARYPAAEAKALDEAMRRMLTRAFVVGQSTWAYDVAWFDWKLDFPLRTDFDTYIAQSVLWPGEPRDLQYLASLYCGHYQRWKDYDSYESKTATCALDVCATFEIARALDARLEQRGLRTQFNSRMRYASYVYRMARRGVLRGPARTDTLRRGVDERLTALEQSAATIAGSPLNLRSPPQVRKALASLGVHVKSTGDAALVAAKARYPDAADMLDAVLEYRSLASLRANFLSAKPGPDGRLRSQISATGTETFRLTSSKDQFGGGANLLNITKSLRGTIVPDAGYTYFSCDLARADLWPVVWEADDAQLKQAMRDGVDIHLFNCVDLAGIKGVPYDEMFESHPNYPEHLARHEKRRKNLKQFAHLTNYGGKARTAGISCKMTTHEAEMAQRRWFSLHPGIKRWHERTMAQLRGTRRVRNIFGYERPYLGRVESMLPEALAWVPQSTVALVISFIHMAFDECSHIEVQMQCYDSLAGQFLTAQREAALAHMNRAWRSVVVPYADPFTIPLDLALSESSWGECARTAWPAP